MRKKENPTNDDINRSYPFATVDKSASYGFIRINAKTYVTALDHDPISANNNNLIICVHSSLSAWSSVEKIIH